MKTLMALLMLTIVSGCCTKKGCPTEIPEIKIHLIENTGAWLNTKVYSIDRTFDYIIQTDSSSDTISNIAYVVSENRVLCNKCAFGDDYQTVKNYSNFSYQHKGVTYSLNDTLFITL